MENSVVVLFRRGKRGLSINRRGVGTPLTSSGNMRGNWVKPAFRVMVRLVLFILRGPIEAPGVAPGIVVADPVIPAVDRPVIEFDLIRDMPSAHHAELRIRMGTEAEHVAGREQRAARRGGRLVAGQGEETAPSRMSMPSPIGRCSSP